MRPEHIIVSIVGALALLWVRYVQLAARSDRRAREMKLELNESILNRRGRS